MATTLKIKPILNILIKIIYQFNIYKMNKDIHLITNTIFIHNKIFLNSK